MRGCCEAEQGGKRGPRVGVRTAGSATSAVPAVAAALLHTCVSASSTRRAQWAVAGVWLEKGIRQRRAGTESVWGAAALGVWHSGWGPRGDDFVVPQHEGFACEARPGASVALTQVLLRARRASGELGFSAPHGQDCALVSSWRKKCVPLGWRSQEAAAVRATWRLAAQAVDEVET